MRLNIYLQFLLKKTWKPAIPVFAGGLLAIFLIGSLNYFPDGNLHLKFYDVGQGDAILIKTNRGGSILIDGGPRGTITKDLSWDLGFFNNKIDLLILTHPQADHVAGLVDVLRRFKVSNIVYDSVLPTKTFRAFLTEVEQEKKEGAKVYGVKAGDRLSVGEATLSVLWPPDLEATLSGNPNASSLVSLLKFRDFEALLPGDLETREAEKMLGAAEVGDIEVLKVSHHGAKNGLSKRIIEVLRPEIAVISVGRNNSYGHPHSIVLDMLKSIGARILRTDMDGTVEVITDGHQMWLRK